MPRVTKAQKKVHIVSFSNDIVKMIADRFDLNNTEREQYLFEENGFRYYIRKDTFGDLLEIRIWRKNYVKNRNEKPKGTRVYDEAFIYKKYENTVNGIDDGYILDDYSIQGYNILIF